MGCAGSKPEDVVTVQPTASQIGGKTASPRAADGASPGAPLKGAAAGSKSADGDSSAEAPNAIAAAHQVPVGDQVAQAAGSGGVSAVLAMMKEHSGDSEFQWWCCDALASLCAGNEEARAQLYVQNGVLTILAAMRLFPWDENVQTKANWAIANMAASYAEYIGKQGGVDAVVSGMKSCMESYQVLTSGTRCLQNLVAGADANGVRAIKAGAVPLLSESLEHNPEDGQLQWRGQQLLDKLNSMNADDASAAPVEVARNSPWARLRAAVFSGQARRIAAGNIPGLYGVSAQVAAKVPEGIRSVIAFMRDRETSPEVTMWCCDAVATMINGNLANRTAAYEAGVIALVVKQMKAFTWDEELQLKALWALLALAPSYSLDIGAADAISAIVTAMYANKTSHQLQVASIKLLSLLTLEASGENIKRARLANAIRIVKNVIQAHTEDGTLQYRGVNLLERLEPGCTMSMPKVNMVRTASMQAEEMVLQARRSARTFTERNLLEAAGAQRSGGVVGGTTPEQAALNAQAIREVDELAEAVEEDESDDEGGKGGGGGGGGHRRGAASSGHKEGGDGPDSGSGGGAGGAGAADATSDASTASMHNAAGGGIGGDAGASSNKVVSVEEVGPASLPGAVASSPNLSSPS